MINLHAVEQGSPEWHALRAPLYTGSNADRLLKFGAIEYSRNLGASFGGNFYTWRGHVLEDEAIELYQQIVKQVGIRLEGGKRVGFVTNTKYPTAGYSPDDLYPDYTVEVKAFKEDVHLQLINGEIPLKVLAQIHFGLLICEKPYSILLPYNPELDAKQALKIIKIKANRNIQNNFKRILKGKEVTHV